jgi:hypothetical protein
MMLMKLDLIEGLVVKRPSRHVKTPYVADVLVGDKKVSVGVGDRKEVVHRWAVAVSLTRRRSY